MFGHVVEDRGPDGWEPGGPSLYAARTLAALGMRVTLVTGLAPDFDRSALAGVTVRAQPIARQPRYANEYDAAGRRTQVLLGRGPRLSTTFTLRADLLFLAPAYHELSALPENEARLVAVSLQGVLRSAGRAGAVKPHPRPKAQARRFIVPGVLAFFSDEDTPNPERLARQIAHEGGVAVVTRGDAGAILVTASALKEYEGLAADVVDPTGAGDCFAAAFACRYLETGDFDRAARFAMAAGALATEGRGLAGVPTRGEIEARLARAAA